MPKSKTKKRRDGAQFMGQLKDSKPRSSKPIPKRIRKLSDEQLKRRVKAKRPKVEGKRSELKELKAKVKGPTTKNLVPGPGGQMESPLAQHRRELGKLRKSLSGFRGLRRESERRELRPEPAGNKDRKQTNPRPDRPALGSTAGTPRPPIQGVWNASQVPASQVDQPRPPVTIPMANRDRRPRRRPRRTFGRP